MNIKVRFITTEHDCRMSIGISESLFFIQLRLVVVIRLFRHRLYFAPGSVAHSVD